MRNPSGREGSSGSNSICLYGYNASLVGLAFQVGASETLAYHAWLGVGPILKGYRRYSVSGG
jgi:hypothetical protein